MCGGLPQRTHSRIAKFNACMALRNNAAPMRRAKLARSSTSAKLLDKILRGWMFIVVRRRVGVSFARCLARKETTRLALAALAAWRLQVALDLQQSACEMFVSGESSRLQTFTALCALRRSIVRRFYSVFDLWHQTARQERCVRRLCSVQVPAMDSGLQYRVLLKTHAWGAENDRALRRQLRHDVAALIAHHCMPNGGSGRKFPRALARVEEQVRVGSVLHLVGAEAEEYVKQSEEHERNGAKQVPGHLADLRQPLRRFVSLIDYWTVACGAFVRTAQKESERN